MPRKINNSEPPKVMTWSRATPVLIVAAIFDALRFMFEWFIFFGPALAGTICTVAGSGTAIGKAVGTAGTALGCAAGAGVVGFFGAGVIEPFGMVMAMATGFAGWLTILIIFLVFNARIFKENALWFGGSLLLSEIPFVGSLPAFTFTVWRMYGRQIKSDKEAFAKWKKENAAQQRQIQNQQNAQIMQAQAIQQEVLNQEWEGQMSQQEQEEQQAIGEEATQVADMQPPDAPMYKPPLPRIITPSPRLTTVPNYSEPSKIHNN